MSSDPERLRFLKQDLVAKYIQFRRNRPKGRTPFWFRVWRLIDGHDAFLIEGPAFVGQVVKPAGRDDLVDRIFQEFVVQFRIDVHKDPRLGLRLKLVQANFWSWMRTRIHRYAQRRLRAIINEEKHLVELSQAESVPAPTIDVELEIDLRVAIDSLHRPQRAVMRLKKAGYTDEETARKLGYTLDRTKYLIEIALIKLKWKLGKDYPLDWK